MGCLFLHIYSVLVALAYISHPDAAYLCLFQKAGKETRFFQKKPGFSLTQTANLSKLGLEEQSVKPQIKLPRGAENRL